jgi:hypothetical protein
MIKAFKTIGNKFPIYFYHADFVYKFNSGSETRKKDLKKL